MNELEYRAAGFPTDDIKVLPYNHTAALIVRWRAAGKTKLKPLAGGH